MAFTWGDWRAAAEMVREADRQRLGPPDQISDETLAAYVDGLLSEEECDRVREFVVAYPELGEIVLLIHAANEFSLEDVP